MEYQYHFDRKFYQDKKTGYWISSNCPKIRAHRWVWINIHGNIPKGYHIHHKDENKSNNAIENLELIEQSRHLSIHSSTEESRNRSRIHMNEIRHLTKAWHGSEEGRKWHRLHAIRCNFGKNEPIDFICDNCGIAFQSVQKSRTRFCSNNCKSRWRRKAGLDDIDRNCVICGNSFKVNKYQDTKTCGKACKALLYKKHAHEKGNLCI